MEAVIHHFKLWTEDSPPKGEFLSAVESPARRVGVYLESDGGPNPIGFTGGLLHLQTCKFCLYFPKAYSWPIWSL